MPDRARTSPRGAGALLPAARRRRLAGRSRRRIVQNIALAATFLGKHCSPICDRLRSNAFRHQRVSDCRLMPHISGNPERPRPAHTGAVPFEPRSKSRKWDADAAILPALQSSLAPAVLVDSCLKAVGHARLFPLGWGIATRAGHPSRAAPAGVRAGPRSPGMLFANPAAILALFTDRHANSSAPA
jgi:hypothetical protein